METYHRAKVLIIGGTIFARNRGVAAITNGCVHSLRKNMNNPRIALLHTFVETFYPRRTTNIERMRVIIDSDTYFLHFRHAVFRIFLVLSYRFLLYLGFDAKLLSRDRVLREYKAADVVVNLSYGDAFTYRGRYYADLVFFSLVYQSYLAILLKKPLIFYPQSIGPFRGRFARLLARLVLDRCDIIMVRENLSRRILQEMGLTTPVQLIPDIAFLLKPAQDEIVSEILLKENAKIEHPLIGFSLRNVLAEHIDVISEVIDYLTHNLDAVIILIPHDSTGVTWDRFSDPRLLAEEVLTKVKLKSRVCLIRGEYAVEELKGIIGKCDLFIGSYMHSNISALSMGVPTIAISYSHKTDGIMSLIGLDDLVLQVADLATAPLTRKIEKVWRDRSRIKGFLYQKIRVLEKAALRAGRLVESVNRP